MFYIYRPYSLKNTIKQHMYHAKDPIQYEIQYNSHMDAVTQYVAEKIINYSWNSSKVVITLVSGWIKTKMNAYHFDDNNY